LNQVKKLVNHRTQYEFDAEMESAAKATNNKDKADGVKPMLCLTCKQLQPPIPKSPTDPDPDTLPPLPPTPDPEITNKAENPDSKG
jgi:hypothetical protein